MMTPALTYTLPWDFKEHVRATRALTAVTLRRQPLRRAFMLGWPLILLLMALLPKVVWTRSPIDWTAVVVGMAPWLLVVLFFYALTFWGTPYLAAWRTKRNDPATQAPLTRTIDSDGFRITGPSISISMGWPAISAVVETKQFFLIYATKVCAYYIPKHVVGSPSEVAHLRDRIRELVGDRAELLSTTAG
jgi:hypothetical protein